MCPVAAEAASHRPDDIRVGGGVLGLVQQASNGIIKAVQQGSVAHAEMGGEMGGSWDREGQRLVEGLQVSNGRCGVLPRVADRFMNGR